MKSFNLSLEELGLPLLYRGGPCRVTIIDDTLEYLDIGYSEARTSPYKAFNLLIDLYQCESTRDYIPKIFHKLLQNSKVFPSTFILEAYPFFKATERTEYKHAFFGNKYTSEPDNENPEDNPYLICYSIDCQLRIDPNSPHEITLHDVTMFRRNPRRKILCDEILDITIPTERAFMLFATTCTNFYFEKEIQKPRYLEAFAIEFFEFISARIRDRTLSPVSILINNGYHLIQKLEKEPVVTQFIKEVVEVTKKPETLSLKEKVIWYTFLETLKPNYKNDIYKFLINQIGMGEKLK